jgi:hypothetical protein
VIYLDTSYLVKVYADEPGSADVLEWLEGKGELVCSLHGRLELISAFKRHQREGRLTGTQVNAAVRQVSRDEAAGLLTWLPISSALVATACDLVASAQAPLFLRAADALHLASARDAGLRSIHSHDQHLLTAAPHFGLKGVDVIGGSG